jgi:hypothetical protein
MPVDAIQIDEHCSIVVRADCFYLRKEDNIAAFDTGTIKAIQQIIIQERRRMTVFDTVTLHSTFLDYTYKTSIGKDNCHIEACDENKMMTNAIDLPTETLATACRLFLLIKEDGQ